MKVPKNSKTRMQNKVQHSLKGYYNFQKATQNPASRIQ